MSTELPALIREYRKAATLRMQQQEFRFPENGTAFYFKNDADPGVPILNYDIRLKKEQYYECALTISRKAGGQRVVVDHVPAVWQIRKDDYNSKIVYWFHENTDIVFTVRHSGRIRITYPADQFDDVLELAQLNFSRFGILCPFPDSGESDPDDAIEATVPGPAKLPFHRPF